MLGLRLIEGLTHQRVEHLLGGDAAGPARRAAIQKHRESGLIEVTPTHLRLSRRGLMLADTVLSDLV